jgi:hypothetical protein
VLNTLLENQNGLFTQNGSLDHLISESSEIKTYKAVVVEEFDLFQECKYQVPLDFKDVRCSSGTVSCIQKYKYLCKSGVEGPQ